MKKMDKLEEINDILIRPSLKEAIELVRAGISRKKTVIVVGNCSVNYYGRASSKLEPGERIAIFKSDGSTLIHRPKDYAPVNWQPPGSIFRTRLNDEQLQVRAFRRKENEVLEVKFDDVLLVSSLDLKDTGGFFLYASEKDMQEAIMLEPSLLEEGFRPISSEKQVQSGYIDILGRDVEGILTIVEIKRNPATKEDVLQLQKYIDEFKADEGGDIRGILVAPDLARGAQSILAALRLEFKPLSPEKCSFVLKNRDKKRLTEFFTS